MEPEVSGLRLQLFNLELLARLWFAAVGRAASLALARILALSTSITGFAAALPLTIVLTFARVFTLFSVSYGLEGDARIAQRARGIGTHSDGPGQEAGNGGAGNYCFGWSYHLWLFAVFYG